jgi:RNA polymerase sigma factor (sigma-70 family)
MNGAGETRLLARCPALNWRTLRKFHFCTFGDDVANQSSDQRRRSYQNACKRRAALIWQYARLHPTKGRAMESTDPIESTATLLRRVRGGDLVARERLCTLYLPILRRWAAGQMPANHRDLVDTSDLTQITLLRVLDQIHSFEPRHEGAFLGYLRDALMSAIRDEIRRSSRRGGGRSIEMDDADWHSLVVESVGMDTMADYEKALAGLAPDDREAVILRFEFGMSFEEIASATERVSPDAARMAVKRALAALSKLIT